MIFHMPLPQMLNTMIAARAMRARGQQVEALDTAEGARFSPIQMMMGPVTTGGRKRMTFRTPTAFTSRARIRYSSPATTMPPQA